MTDEREQPGTSGRDSDGVPRPIDEPTLAALFRFDPADELAEDVSDVDAAVLRQLFAEAADDEPEGGPTPLGVIAAATRSERAQAERVGRERARRRGRVLKGVLIAAAVAAVVVVVPVTLRGGSSSDSAGTASVAAATSAAATSEAASAPAAAEAATSAAVGSAGSGFDTDSKTGARAPAAGGTSTATSAAATSAAESSAAGSASVVVPSATAPVAGTTAFHSAGGGTDSDGGVQSDESASPTSAVASGGCVWPELKPAAAAAALRALGLPADTDVEPTTGPCVTGRVGAMYIPIVQVTVWVRHGGDLATWSAVDSATARAAGDGLTVAVSKPSSTNFEGPMPASLQVAAQAVLHALT